MITIGVANPTGIPSGFSYPIFSPDGVQTFVQVMDENNRITGFEELVLGPGEFYPVSRSLSRSVGELAAFGFMFSLTDIIIAERSALIRVLRRRISVFTSRPFLRLEIAQFVNDESLLQGAIEAAFRTLVTSGEERARRWLRSVQPSDDRPTIALVFYLLERLRAAASTRLTLEPGPAVEWPIATLFFEPVEGAHVREIVYVSPEPTKFDFEKLQRVLAAGIPGETLVDRLQFTPDAFATILTVGDLARGISDRLTPPSLRNIAPENWWAVDLARVFPHNLSSEGSFAERWTQVAPVDVLQRVRVLSLPPDELMRLLVRETLKSYFKRPQIQKNDPLQDLLTLVQQHSGHGSLQYREVLLHPFDFIQGERLEHSGKWIRGDALLQQTGSGMGNLLVSKLIAQDFSAADYLHRPEFDQAWELLRTRQRLVITGPLGTGKSSLCRWLAFQYLSHYPEQQIYSLSVDSIGDLVTEHDFVQGRLGMDGLFIIDDQQLAPDAVDRILQLFMGIDRSRAWVVVSSSLSFTPTQAGSVRESGGVLDDYATVRLAPLSEAEFGQFMNNYRFSPGREIDLQIGNETLYRLSNGIPGHALIIARTVASGKWTLNPNNILAVSTSELLIRWVLDALPAHITRAKFDNDFAPLFVLGATGLPVSHLWGESASLLLQAGVIEPIDVESGSAPASGYYRPVSLELFMQIAQIYGKKTEDILDIAYRREPERFPDLIDRFSRTARRGRGRKRSLQRFIEANLMDIADHLHSLKHAIPLRGVVDVLVGIRRVSRKLARQLVSALMHKGNSPNEQFWKTFLVPERSSELQDVGRFFTSLADIRPGLTRRIGRFLDDDVTVHFLGDICRLRSPRLDTIGSYLQALTRVSPKVARELFDDFYEEGLLELKGRSLESYPQKLLLWLRFCDAIRYVDRGASRDYLSREVPSEKMIAAVITARDFGDLREMLLLYRKLAVREASGIILDLWTGHRGVLRRLLTQESQLDHLTNYLYALSRANRRIGVQIAYDVRPHIETLLGGVKRHRSLGSTLRSLSKAISPRFGRDIAGAINRTELVKSLQSELRDIDRVGVTLMNIHAVSPELSEWTVEHLAYSHYLILGATYDLRRLVQLIRGLLVTSSPEHRAHLVTRMLEDQLLITEFAEAWNDTSSLSTIAFATSAFLNIPISADSLARLMGRSSRESMESEILTRVSSADSLVQLAHGLLATARLDPNLAETALSGISERIIPFDSGDDQEDLVEVGQFLQVAAAVDPKPAMVIASRTVNRLSVLRRPREEANLGRIGHFLMGLYSVSRVKAVSIAGDLVNEEHLSDRLYYNDEPWNCLLFARVLAKIDVRASRSFASKLISVLGSEMETMIEVESNASLLAQWFWTVKQAGLDFPSARYIDLAREVAGFDSDLYHLVDLGTSMLIGEPTFSDSAEWLVRSIRASANQIRNANHLTSIVNLLHRVRRIQRAVGDTDLEYELVQRFDEEQIEKLLMHERSSLVMAHAYLLLSSIGGRKPAYLNGILHRLRPLIVRRAAESRSPLDRILSLSMLGGESDLVEGAAQSAIWRERISRSPRRAWELGLAAVISRAFERREEINPLASLVVNDTVWSAVLTDALGEEPTNLEFGLTRHWVALTAPPDFEQNQIKSSLRERIAEAEGLPAWLLSQPAGYADVAGQLYPLWVMTRDSVLRSTYISWEDQIEQFVSRAAYDQHFAWDVTDLLKNSILVD
ncbi:MAG TPA: hypothetical protein VGC13_30075 [Longimicrobium sp.]|jgi:hypothetical protein|uniref:nSTAND3 domain-containing NTPase n=1 Tax=Longimicrobium sp. TaxID=2029185 RepID=UPI002EDAA778